MRLYWSQFRALKFMYADLHFLCMYTHVHVHQTNCLLLTNMDTVRIFTAGQISDTPVLEDMLNVYQEHNLTLGNKFTCTFNGSQLSEEHARSSMRCTMYH